MRLGAWAQRLIRKPRVVHAPKATQPPSLILIGTSNSLMREGFRRVLAARGERIANLALGASTGVLHGLRVAELEALSGGVAIYDHCVNETKLERRRGASEEIQRGAFESFLAICGDRAIMPFVLIMPSLGSWGRASGTRRIARDLAHRHRVPFFDGYDYLDRARATLPGCAAFADPGGSHPDAPIARMIGHALADTLASVRAGQWSYEPAEVSRLGAIDLLAGAPTERTIEHATALERRTLRVLDANEAIRVARGGWQDLVGIAFNAGASAGVLAIEGGTARAKLLQSSLSGTKPYLFVAWPFKTPIALTASEITLTCLDRGYDRADERHEHMTDDIHRGPFRLELAALIARGPPRPARLPRFDGAIDLVATLDPAQIVVAAGDEGVVG